MISYAQARHIAEAYIPETKGIIEESIIEKPYGWYFNAQSLKWLETRDENHMFLGSNGFIVDRENGRVVEYGSRNGSVDNIFCFYESGFSYKHYNFTIKKVKNYEKSLRFLIDLQLIERKIVCKNGNFLVLPAESGLVKMEEIIKSLPFTFYKQRFGLCYDVLYELKSSTCLEHELHGYDESE